MNVVLFSSLMLISQCVFSQSFTEIVSALPNAGAEDGSIAIADVNGDTHLDVLITGLDVSEIPVAKLYINDGTGNYSESLGTPFDAVHESSIAFADVNGDTHMDVLITGDKSTDDFIAKLYTNDGSGNFTESIGTSFVAVEDGAIAFADVNGDMHPDVLITGNQGLETPVAKLYINDGNGNFTEGVGASFDGVEDAAIAFADVNGDTFQDVLITGENGSGTRIAKLYTNGGSGNFIESASNPFDGVEDGTVDFADVNGDTHPDVLITGKNTQGQQIAKLYTNNGSGVFSILTGSAFEAVEDGSVAFGDINADNHPDVVITGENNTGVNIAKLYTNDGTGMFTEVVGTPFEGVDQSSIALADVDGDTHLDLLITGLNSIGVPVAKLYINDEMTSSIGHLGPGNMTEILLYPNPSTTGQVAVMFSSERNLVVDISLVDIHGKTLHHLKNHLSIGENVIEFDFFDMARGLYFLKISDEVYVSSLKLKLE